MNRTPEQKPTDAGQQSATLSEQRQFLEIRARVGPVLEAEESMGCDKRRRTAR